MQTWRQFKENIEQNGLDNLINQLKQKYPTEDLFAFENNYMIHISSIKIKPDSRSQGFGSEIIREIQKYAEKVGKPVVLVPSPEPRKKDALLRFYKNLGFRKNSGRYMDYKLSTPFGITWVWKPNRN